MAQAARATAVGTRRGAVALLAAAVLLGLAFAAIKVGEYVLEYREHLVPMLDFAFEPSHAHGARVFFGFYFVMTGLHLIHLAVGIAIVTALAWRVAREHAHAMAEPVEIGALYWHFVDIVWIFLYPCLYLIARA
jgi:cytochrome c oxidase subunit 3